MISKLPKKKQVSKEMIDNAIKFLEANIDNDCTMRVIISHMPIDTNADLGDYYR